ncbi:hypothetical protein B2M20_17815 [Nitrobacter vulgaris]|uniref:Uncharacterized protein n=1 Tax=Nitrobacter vulgaris TaxID=29421 RepID=A0A1V4HTY3_NITVU|nr:hypothetical protein B2M20_17815 [Nitrobacter vulgaris]
MRRREGLGPSSRVKIYTSKKKYQGYIFYWTNDDVRTLKALAKQRAGVAKIAQKLNRTPGATAAKACALDISLSTT